MKKIGVMGGTFNPIHNGHVALAQAAYDFCQLDEVWFMPSGCSYMKSKDNVVAGEDRLEMTRLAIEGIPYFKCSDLEVKRAGNTYTAETLEILSELYPKNKFFFIMGADSLFGLPRWKHPEKISALCTLAAVIRDDVDLNELEKQKQYLEEAYGADIVLLPFQKIDISSSLVREKLERCEAVNGIIPEKVLAYIKEKNLYKKELSIDELRDDMKKIQDAERYEHTLGVAYTAASLAVLNGVDSRKALIAGLLHDCAKCIPSQEKIDLCKSYGISMTKLEERNPFLLHAKLGARLAKENYYENDDDILNAIENHTTGRANMSILEKIVFIADYIEPNRNKAPNLLQIRRMAYNDIDQALVMILQDTLNYLEQTGNEVDPGTKETLMFYLNK